jgi:glutaredoxin
MRAYLIAAAILWITCSDAAGQAYRWVDEQGRVHYTQTPPPPRAKEVQRKDFRAGPAATADLPYATQLAAKNYPVTLYAQPECGPLCDQARAVLVKRGVPFREVTVFGQKDIEEVKKVSGEESLPLVVVGSLFQSGFSEGGINSLLDTAGYPRAVSPVPVQTLRKAEPATPPPAPAAPSQPSTGYR